jgi:hypothetical protein
MSQLEVDKVIPQSGTTLTLGESGDTVSVPSGATLSGTSIALSGNIGLGGATPTTSGTGITFPATASASTDANTLDDYEEGTWTPDLSFGGSNTGITYSIQAAKYTKIGNRVLFDLAILLTSKGVETGAANITLPFTPSDEFPATGHESAVTIGFLLNANANFFRAGIFSSNIIIFDSTSSNAAGETQTAFNNNTNVRMTGSYKTNA